MKNYVLRRLIAAVPLVFAVVIFNFILIHAAPGDPVLLLTGEYTPTPELRAAIEEKFGLNKPLGEQILLYVGYILRGDLGESIKFRRPVLTVIGERIGPTFLLMGISITMSIALGVLLGVAAARRPNSTIDSLASSLSVFGWSIPIFWLAQLLMIVFAVNLRMFPTTGMTSVKEPLIGLAQVLDVMWHLFLPSLTIALLRTAQTFRLTRASMLEVLGQDFILTARSKGLSERTTLFKHALKNAMRPIITMTGLQFGTMLAGATMVEIVYSWPGMGRLIYEAAIARDYPLLMGVYFLSSLLVFVANLVTDIVHAFYDPRVRLE